MKRLLDVKPPEAEAAGGPALLTSQGGGTPALAGPGGAEGEDDGTTIDMGQVEGRVRQSSVKKVGQIVENHPEEAVAILRSWMVQQT